MATASAPGKAILFGEHAVVYGKPAIACAINKRAFAEAAKNSSGKISIKAEVKDLRYVKKSIEVALRQFNIRSGLDVRVSSEIPAASGLGSSAAVSVATIASIAKEFKIRISKSELAKLAHSVEKEVQGAASPTDTATSAFGGILFIGKNKIEPLNYVNLNLVIGYTGEEKSTKELVRMVRERKEKNKVLETVIDCIGDITSEAEKLIRKISIANSEKEKAERYSALGELMNINHGLLESLGVGTLKLAQLVHTARARGALGAKITGAGGGGCMIALAPSASKAKKISAAIEKLGFTAMNAEIDKEGAK